MDVTTYKTAYDQGRASALSLKVGDIFSGAFGAAETYGLKRETVEYNIFVTGFIGALPAVFLDKNNVIGRIENK